jgi:hypothetical protein
MLNLILIGLLFILIKYAFVLYKTLRSHLKRERIWKHIPLSMRIKYEYRSVK